MAFWEALCSVLMEEEDVVCLVKQVLSCDDMEWVCLVNVHTSGLLWKHLLP